MMGFEPQKLLVGLVDFFAVLLPGALFTFLFADTLGPSILGDRYSSLAGRQGEGAFLLASYLIGHFIFLTGSLILDEFCYEPFRAATRTGQIRRLAVSSSKRKWRPNRVVRWVAKQLKLHTADEPVRFAELLKQRELGRLGAGDAMNTFQWAKVSLADTPATTDIHRFEADSKFFRSLVVVLSCWAVWAAIHTDWKPAVLSVALAVVAFVRYIEQRMKATRQAYWAVLARRAADATAAPLWAQPVAPGVTHAGGVVLRRSSAAVLEVLLVSAHTNPEQLVLPKGHIEPGETEAETAVREVLEESGVWATVIGTAQTVQFTTGGTDYGVAFFPMMHIATDRVSTEHRSVEWVAVEGIAKRGVLPESADLVATFQGDARVIRQLNGA